MVAGCWPLNWSGKMETAPSRKGTALAAGITAIVSLAAKDNLTTAHLICIAVIAALVTVYIVGQVFLKLKEK